MKFLINKFDGRSNLISSSKLFQLMRAGRYPNIDFELVQSVADVVFERVLNNGYIKKRSGYLSDVYELNA